VPSAEKTNSKIRADDREEQGIEWNMEPRWYDHTG
jgi:hypothetical protein